MFSYIPAEMVEHAAQWRAKLVELVVEQDDDLLQAWLDGQEQSVEELQVCIRKGTLAGTFVPILAGSAYKNRGVETVLDAVIDYLPALDEVKNDVESDMNGPLVVLLFKVAADDHGQLAFLCIYHGCLKVGDTVLNATTGKRERVSRLYEMHANKKHEIIQAEAGSIVTVVGLKDSMTGHTYVRS